MMLSGFSYGKISLNILNTVRHGGFKKERNDFALKSMMIFSMIGLQAKQRFSPCHVSWPK